MNDNKKETKEQKPNFMTLHMTHKGQQKTLTVGIRHATAACLAASLVLSGSVYTFGAYHKTKNALQASEEQLQASERENRKLEQKTEVLQSEKTAYADSIEEIQTKTTELEQKMNELETMKQDLYKQIQQLNANEVSSSEFCTAMANTLENPALAAPTFTKIVNTSYYKMSSLSNQLEKMDVLLDETGYSFQNVATDVTEALSEHNNIPMGYPVESTIITTEFNPTGSSAISDGRKHKGIDISTRSRIIPVVATAGGTVVTSTYHNGFGNYVVIDHGNGFTTLYAHNSSLLVNVGDTVQKGDTIAMTGSTGYSTGVHCHYEIQLNGVYQNPRDYL